MCWCRISPGSGFTISTSRKLMNFLVHIGLLEDRKLDQEFIPIIAHS